MFLATIRSTPGVMSFPMLGSLSAWRPKAFEVLVYLLTHCDRVVSKQELCEQIWPEQFISDATLGSTLRAVRQALGDSGSDQRFIQTVHGYGYRFVAAMTRYPMTPVVDDEQEALVLAPPAGESAAPPMVMPTLEYSFPPGMHREPRYPFIGRERELALLQECLDQVKAGIGHVVGVIGTSGVGKSRLLFEFCRRLPGKTLTYVQGRCLFHGRMTPYVLVRDLLRYQCGLTEADSPATLTTKVHQRLQALGIEAEEILPYLMHLLGVYVSDDRLAGLRLETIQARIFIALRQMTLTCSRQRPLIIAVEDLHWIDPTSDTWLASLVEYLTEVPILLLATFRPEYQPVWMEQPYVVQIPLRPLTLQESLHLVDTIAVQAHLPAPLAQAIAVHAAGYPLFLEELTRAVVEHEPHETLGPLPDALAEVLVARIARLPEASRQLLQTASILGPACALPVLEALWKAPDELTALLSALEQDGWCTTRLETAGTVYAFTHVLVQEIAYASLPVAQRRHLHRATGQVLEALYAHDLRAVGPLLAYHYGRAADASKAIRYLIQVAEHAVSQCGHTEAITAMEEALSYVRQLPTQAQVQYTLDLVLRQAHSLFAVGRFQEALPLLLQQQPHLVRCQDMTLAGRYALLFSQVLGHLGVWKEAAQHARQAAYQAASAGDTLTLGQASHMLAMTSYWSGEPLQGIHYGRQAIELLQQSPERYQLGIAYSVLGLNALIHGDFEQALEADTQASAIGEALREPSLQTFAAWATGWLQATRGAWDAGIAACQQALQAAPDSFSTSLATGWLGYTYLEQGEPHTALPLLEQAIEGMRQFRYGRLEGLYTTFLSLAYLADGQLDTAHTLAQQGLTVASAEAYRVGIAWAERTLGRIAQAAGSLETAGDHFRKALETFAALPARFEVARTHLALGELFSLQANREDTIHHLITAYRLFEALRMPTYMQYARRHACPFGYAFS